MEADNRTTALQEECQLKESALKIAKAQQEKARNKDLEELSVSGTDNISSFTTGRTPAVALWSSTLHYPAFDFQNFACEFLNSFNIFTAR